MTVDETRGERGSGSPPARPRVLFVDDEPHLLSALRRTLRGVRPTWQVKFAGSGEEALRMIDEEEVDAVVSDMRMPWMDGATLLAQVQQRSPATARIVLSGQADVESVLSVVRSAQKFLAKPCDTDVLVEAIERTLQVQARLTDPRLRSLIGGIGTVPALPACYHDLVTAMKQPAVDLDRIADIIGQDVAATTDLLKLVNSAFFSLPRTVVTVRSAVALLGLDNIQALVLAGQLFQVSDRLAGRIDVKAFQTQALTRAAVARAVANSEGWPSHECDIAALACMLRDVGRLVLTEGLPERSDALAAALDRRVSTSPQEMAELEREHYGCTVTEASGYLLGLWAFAPAVVHAVASYPPGENDPADYSAEEVLEFSSRCVPDPHVTWPDPGPEHGRGADFRRWLDVTGAVPSLGVSV